MSCVLGNFTCARDAVMHRQLLNGGTASGDGDTGLAKKSVAADFHAAAEVDLLRICKACSIA